MNINLFYPHNQTKEQISATLEVIEEGKRTTYLVSIKEEKLSKKYGSFTIIKNEYNSFELPEIRNDRDFYDIVMKIIWEIMYNENVENV